MITHFELIMIALTTATSLLIPAVVIMIRGAVKWTRTEDQLGHLVDRVGDLVNDKDQVHHEILEQMRLDREATNTRLRYLEEFQMNRGRRTFGGRG